MTTITTTRVTTRRRHHIRQVTPATSTIHPMGMIVPPATIMGDRMPATGPTM